MLKRVIGLLVLDDEEPLPATRQLHEEGWVALRGVFEAQRVREIRSEVDDVFERFPLDRPRPDSADFRYAMYNRSAACRQAMADRAILDVIEPLLGDDCHVIANTAWRNTPEFRGQPWHTDAGPHVPRPEGVPWDDRIPYPVFAVACHILLADLREADGGTAVLPGSHRSGRLPPGDRIGDLDLTFEGGEKVVLTGSAGDVFLFCSDVWHRGLPAGEGARGRCFLQVHYGRRDLAQRVYTTREVNSVDPAVAAQVEGDPRMKTLLGLHDPFFYDG